ncbi:uncharacterized membrane-anchored protein YitT (DUF2179 family) [Enterococcus sp. PF1-24]|uniref:YitT family protein n=1 Tax=unclassified Enterococcus TaxID=2608891 RepID=UPI002473D890|nr:MULTISPECIES: YitT family protein [unclassified Enterococcus]MDH6364033.1 uncharacterized membrane-anchored protein YitT (DUF2179 family) [Enterococcus sp. PFB1-1]MDH6401134.1 uncharacterized membrane-anchored protein YitT (DUF2179 family) [Enterococcus sp. PF1-24]
MSSVVKNYQKNEFIKRGLAILITAISGALALNYFLIPANVLSAGINGIAQIISKILNQEFSLQIDTGIFIFLLNMPIFVLSFLKLGKEATIYSFINVLGVSLFTTLLPTGQITDNIMLNAIVGGVLLGVGGGFSLKMGFTTGGMDIISLVLSKTTGRTVGKYMFFLNSLIVLFAGLIFDWESALFTIVSIFCMSQVVDMIHTSHQKLTVMIVTEKADQICEAVSQQMFRGMTLLNSQGGFRKTQNTTIMMVITRYELYQLEQILHEVDENAFVNVLATQGIIGQFANEEEQRYYKSTGNFPEMKKHGTR